LDRILGKTQNNHMPLRSSSEQFLYPAIEIVKLCVSKGWEFSMRI